MTRQEIREYRNTIAGAAALVALILGAQGLLDRLERDHEDRLSYRAWVADACTPKRGETAVAEHDGQRLRCTIYVRNAKGFAPVVVSAAVMEMPL